MCVGPGRMPESMITLSFDYRLTPKPDRTILISPYTEQEFCTIFNRFGLEFKNFTVVNDDYFKQHYDLERWWSLPWYRQQALKFCALDHYDSSWFLIQDCDLVLLKPYDLFVDDKINFKLEEFWNPYQRIYSEMAEQITGLKQVLPGSVVNEIMPCSKQDWLGLKNTVETKHSKSFWDVVPDTRAFEELQWLSEYELLAMYITNTRTEWQHFSSVSQPPITSWDDFYNIDWSKYWQIKFNVRPMRYMTVTEAEKMLEFLKDNYAS
jgi:hypothetical protein